jgi:hypothetical protein
MKTIKLFTLVVVATVLVGTGIPLMTGKVQAQGAGTSPSTAKVITVAACSSATVSDTAATADAGTNIGLVDTIVYGATTLIQDWYTFTLDKADNVRFNLVTADSTARLDLLVFAASTRMDTPEGVVTIDLSTGTAATKTIGPRRLDAGKYTIGIRAGTGGSSYMLTVTRGSDTTQILRADNGLNATVLIGGSQVLNCYAPTRTPATIDTYSVFFRSPTGSADISGQKVTYVVYADPDGMGKPLVGATPIFQQEVTLPTQNYISGSRFVSPPFLLVRPVLV